MKPQAQNTHKTHKSLRLTHWVEHILVICGVRLSCLLHVHRRQSQFFGDLSVIGNRVGREYLSGAAKSAVELSNMPLRSGSLHHAFVAR